MTADRDLLTVHYEEEGVVLVKELGKEILSKGAWTTILFKYQEWDAKNNKYGGIKYTIRRYQKWREEYRAKAKFNISSQEQAQKIINALSAWLKEDAAVEDHES